MFALEHLHDRDDMIVRDRELRAWVADNGAGLPLYLGAMERRIVAELRSEVESLRREQHEQRAAIRADIDAHQPIWSRLRRLRRRMSR